MNKRTFLKRAALVGAGLPIGLSAIGSPSASSAPLTSLAERLARFDGRPPAELATDEDFWTGIRGRYRLKPDYINLENGYYNIQPTEIYTSRYTLSLHDALPISTKTSGQAFVAAIG